MRVFSKIFKSVRRNDEDDTIIPYVNNNNTSSSATNHSKKKKGTSSNTTNTSSSSAKSTSTSTGANLLNIYGDLNGHDDEDTKSVDSSSNSNPNSIDYSKLNIEDVFDFEGIDSMCREAEDLNLIEFLTQEKIIQKLIEYVTCTHTEIPSYLEYKLLEATSSSSNLQQFSGGTTEDHEEMMMGHDHRDDQHDDDDGGPMRRLRSPTGDDNSDAHGGMSEAELLIYQQQKQQYLNSQQQDHIRPSMDDQEDSTTTTTSQTNLQNSDKREYLLQKLNYKYPFVATEILISTIGQFHILPLIMLPYSYQTDTSATNATTTNATTTNMIGNHHDFASITLNTSFRQSLTVPYSSSHSLLGVDSNVVGNNVLPRVDDDHTIETIIGNHHDEQQQHNTPMILSSTPTTTTTHSLLQVKNEMDLDLLSSSSNSNNNYNNNNNSINNNSINNNNNNNRMASFHSRVALLNSELIRRKLFSFIYQEKPLNAFQVKCFVRVIIAMMKIPHLTHLVMDYIYALHDIQEFTSLTSSTTSTAVTSTTAVTSSSTAVTTTSSTAVTSSATTTSTTPPNPLNLPNPSTTTWNHVDTSHTSYPSQNSSTTHIILQMLKHIDSSDEISELLLMCLLYEDEDNDPTQTITAPSGNLIQDSFLNILNQQDEVAVNKNLQVLKLKQQIIQRLCALQCEQNFSRSVTFILTTIIQYRKPITRKPPVIVQYILNRKQMELIIDNTLNITSNSPSFVDNMNFIMNLLFYIATNSQRLFPIQQQQHQHQQHQQSSSNNPPLWNGNIDSMIVDESGIDWRLVLVLVIERIPTFVSLLKDEMAREILKKDPTIIYVEQYHPLHALGMERKKNRWGKNSSEIKSDTTNTMSSSSHNSHNSNNNSNGNNNNNSNTGNNNNNSNTGSSSNNNSNNNNNNTDNTEGSFDFMIPLSFPPLGIYRLKIIELFVMLFKQLEVLNSIYDGYLKQQQKDTVDTTTSLSQLILKSDVLEELIRLLFQYQSSLLHHMIVRLLLDIIEGMIDPFVDALFTRYKLADKLLQVHELNQRLQKEQRTSLAISGFLTVMGQVIGDKQLSVLANNAKWLNFQQYSSDRTFVERIYRVGSQEVQNLPAGEEKRLQELRLSWRERNI